MRRFLKLSSLSLFFGVIFLGALVGQAVAGWKDFNSEQLAQGLGQLSLGHYLVSADFAADVTQNWQSESLQCLLYILATVWFVQRGSPESKKPDEVGLESERDQKLGREVDESAPLWGRGRDAQTAVVCALVATLIG